MERERTESGIRDHTTSEYWNKVYESGNSHEWLRSFKQLESFLVNLLAAPDSGPCILQLGCGDSTLPHDLHSLGYKNQVCVDFSGTVIKQMQQQFPELTWRVDDIRELTSIGDASVDIAIDKSAMDAMIWGSCWDPPEEVRENMGKYVDEVARVLKSGGSWACVSFRQPHFVKEHLVREGIWEMKVEKLQDGGDTSEYFAYVMTKK